MSNDLWDLIQFHFYQAFEIISTNRPQVASQHRAQLTELYTAFNRVAADIGIAAIRPPPVGGQADQEDADDEDDEIDELSDSIGQRMPQPAKVDLVLILSRPLLTLIEQKRTRQRKSAAVSIPEDVFDIY